MKVATWISGIGSLARALVEQLADALEARGVDVSRDNLSNRTGAGILLLDALDEDVLRLICELSHSGRERLLAIPTSSESSQANTFWSLLQAGATDTWLWGGSAEEVAGRIHARLDRWQSVDELASSPVVRKNLVGESFVWQRFMRQTVEIARFTNSSVLLLGESGTGKELVSRLVHTLDARRNKGDLVTLDCTTIVPELSGSEFFGHELGAFTDAACSRDGAFALADGGTLFLDEVGELPLNLQAQLLRVIQEGKYKRVGGNDWHKTDFRLVCATNRNLIKDITEGRFRSDLYFRIASFVLAVPSLDERREDILPLARHFLTELSGKDEPPEIQEPVQKFLVQRSYPGNVRELRQLVCRMAARHVDDGPVTVGNIPEGDRPALEELPDDWTDASFESAIRRALSLGVGLKDIGKDATEAAIRVAVHEEKGNLQRAAKRLGVTDRALQIRRANRLCKAAGKGVHSNGG